MAEGISTSPSPSLEVKGRKQSLQVSLGEHSNLLDAMSSKFDLGSVMAGRESRTVRDAAVRKVLSLLYLLASYSHSHV